MVRHRWGEPNRLTYKTERECLNCRIIKVTWHQNEGGRDRYWTEFWRGEDKLDVQATPACEPVPAEAAP